MNLFRTVCYCHYILPSVHLRLPISRSWAPVKRTLIGATTPQWAMASSFPWFLDHTQRDAPQSVGLLWTSDQPDEETLIWQHITQQTDVHVPRWDSNQQSPGGRPQTYASDRAATGIGWTHLTVKCTLVQALRFCTGRTAHRGSRGNSSTLSSPL